MKAERVSDIEEEIWGEVGGNLKDGSEVLDDLTGSEIERVRDLVYRGVREALGIPHPSEINDYE